MNEFQFVVFERIEETVIIHQICNVYETGIRFTRDYSGSRYNFSCPIVGNRVVRQPIHLLAQAIS